MCVIHVAAMDSPGETYVDFNSSLPDHPAPAETADAALAAASLAFAAPASAQKTLKYAHFQPAKDDQPKHVAALAFKEHVERATNGSVKVEIYPAGQFGKDQPTMEGVKLGTLELAVAHDGAIATVHKPIGVLGIPFLYENHEHAWRVYDSDWLKGFSDDMVKKQGIRLLGLADNGVRHFTNSLRPITSPADMKGMKIRIQPSPVFKTLVESLGASPSAIPWAELPAALQQKVKAAASAYLTQGNAALKEEWSEF